MDEGEGTVQDPLDPIDAGLTSGGGSGGGAVGGIVGGILAALTVSGLACYSIRARQQKLVAGGGGRPNTRIRALGGLRGISTTVSSGGGRGGGGDGGQGVALNAIPIGVSAICSTSASSSETTTVHSDPFPQIAVPLSEESKGGEAPVQATLEAPSYSNYASV